MKEVQDEAWRSRPKPNPSEVKLKETFAISRFYPLKVISSHKPAWLPVTSTKVKYRVGVYVKCFNNV